jgi:hypothetical protein
LKYFQSGVTSVLVSAVAAPLYLSYGWILNPHEESVGGGAGFKDFVLWTGLAGA